ncbi:LPS glycosyltransferase [Proteus penneri ATCC 35198]|nr:LPS glycosyltransferase [Proteus penneri ATCC 35198]
MNTFVINLKDDLLKRDFMRNQLDNIGISYQFIEAIDGRIMSDNTIKQLAYDYPDCYLTKGEIGCTLSHMAIYKKMIEDNIEIALILEDDALLPSNIYSKLIDIKNIDKSSKPNVYILTKTESYIKNKQLNNNIYYAYSVSGTYGYVINKAAAKSLLSKLTPIKYEADMWSTFKRQGLINLYCHIPHLIDNNDKDSSQSSIHQERLIRKNKREHYRHLLKKKEPNYQFNRIKDVIFRKFFYKIEQY